MADRQVLAEWQWELRLPLLGAESKEVREARSGDIEVISAGTLTTVRCTVRTQPDQDPPFARYREVAEAAAAVLVPYGLALDVTMPTVTNQAELLAAGLPVLSYADIQATGSVRHKIDPDRLARACTALLSLNDGDPKWIAARCLRWSEAALAEQRPIEGFVAAWTACNALYRANTAPDTTERDALTKWLSDNMVLAGFIDLCRTQWNVVEGNLSLLAQREWVVGKGQNAVKAGEDLERALDCAKRLGGPKAPHGALAYLEKAAFLSAYALRNVIVHGDRLPPVRYAGGWIPVGAGSGAGPSAWSVQPPAATQQEALAQLAWSAGKLVRPVVRRYLLHVLGL